MVPTYHANLENTYIDLSRISSAAIEVQTLLSGYFDFDDLVLPAIDNPSNNRSLLHYMDCNRSSEVDIGGAFLEASSSESIANDITLW